MSKISFKFLKGQWVNNQEDTKALHLQVTDGFPYKLPVMLEVFSCHDAMMNYDCVPRPEFHYRI